MPYSPFWFESLGDALPWVIPLLAVASLWLARVSEDPRFQRIAERAYFAALMIVAWGTMRTVLSNDSCWFVHTASMGAMVVGGIFPLRSTDSATALDS
jgi:hypothetical protein